MCTEWENKRDGIRYLDADTSPCLRNISARGQEQSFEILDYNLHDIWKTCHFKYKEKEDISKKVYFCQTIGPVFQISLNICHNLHFVVLLKQMWGRGICWSTSFCFLLFNNLVNNNEEGSVKLLLNSFALRDTACQQHSKIKWFSKCFVYKQWCLEQFSKHTVYRGVLGEACFAFVIDCRRIR